MKQTATLALGFGLLLGCGCERAAFEQGAESLDPVAENNPGVTEPTREKTNLPVGNALEPRDENVQLLEDPGANDAKPIAHAVATLHPTQGHQVRGLVEFRAHGEELKVTTRVEGLPEGKHAYHLHLYGDCSAADAASAGTHFNLHGSSKEPRADIARITGNLGELSADASGKATATATLDDASLDGRFGIVGRSVVVHALGNDLDKPPMGGAGSRLACGTIGLAQAGDG